MIEAMVTYAKYNPFQYDKEAHAQWLPNRGNSRQKALQVGGWFGGSPDAFDWNTLSREHPKHFNLEKVDQLLKGSHVRKPTLKARMKTKALKAKFGALEPSLPLDFRTWLMYARESICVATGEANQYPEGTAELQVYEELQQSFDTPLQEGGDVAQVKVPATVMRVDEKACGLRTSHRFCARDLLDAKQYPADDLPEYNLAHLCLPASSTLGEQDNLETLFDNIKKWGSSQSLTVLVYFLPSVILVSRALLRLGHFVQTCFVHFSRHFRPSRTQSFRSIHANIFRHSRTTSSGSFPANIFCPSPTALSCTNIYTFIYNVYL